MIHGKTRRLWLVLLASLALMAAACGQAEEREASDDPAAAEEDVDEYVVGALAQMSGDVAWFGELVQNATQLAIEDINEDGGINGKPFDVKFRDLQNDASVSVSEFRKFIDVDNVPAVMIGSSVALLPTCPIAEEEQVVILNDGASTPEMRDACGEYLISNIPDSSTEMQTLAAYLYDQGHRTAATFNINNDVNLGQKTAFVDAWNDLGGQIVAEETAEVGTQNFRSQITSLRAAEPEVTLVATEAQDTARFFKQASDLNFTSQFAAQSNAVSQEVIDQAAAAVEGTIFAQVIFDPSTNERGSEFEDRYTKRFDESPALLYSALAYDGTLMLAEAIEQAGYSGPAIKDYLRGLDQWEGVSGAVTFSEPGFAERPVMFRTVENGEFVTLDETT